MTNLSVLIIDDNSQRCESLALLLEFMEYDYQQIHSLNEAQLLDNKQFDLILIYAIESLVVSLKKLNESFSSSKVAVLSTENNNLSESRLKNYPNFLGLLDFPVKKQPFKNLISRLSGTRRQAVGVQELSGAVKSSVAILETEKLTGNIPANSIMNELFVGESVVIRQVKKLISQVAKSNASVLILGESGTGKEVVADCLHKLSKRNNMPYVPVNCGAIPKDLLESELFGHEKGAFTGALTARKGRFEMANGGSLFLDEIGDMPLAMQVKILRVLQERIFERVGGNKSLKSDVRIIAATHRNLEIQVKEGCFREDLFYRLNVFPIDLPALRERTEDIPLLFKVINQRMQQESEYSVTLTAESMASLMQHDWPGNVRELSNLIERLGIIFPDEPVGWDDLPEKYQYDISHVSELPDLDAALQEPIQEQETIQETNDAPPPVDVPPVDVLPVDVKAAETYSSAIEILPKDDFDLKEHMATLEYSLIQQALDESDGVVAHAAKRLSMRRTTLVEKMKKYEVMFGGR